ncbi:hypothetical protein F4X33_14445 [Candidatus Poribacteria bacterium]|nr:hypothetical protein [Candidatus Poribacteria bacterium]
MKTALDLEYDTPVAPLGLCRSGKSERIPRPGMPDLQRGDIVGFHSYPFNPTYLLSSVNMS